MSSTRFKYSKQWQVHKMESFTNFTVDTTINSRHLEKKQMFHTNTLIMKSIIFIMKHKNVMFIIRAYIYIDLH